MVDIPQEIYEFNTISYQNSMSRNKCRHRKWYKCFSKPHYRMITKLSRRDRLAASSEVNQGHDNERDEIVEQPHMSGNVLQASTLAMAGSRQSLLNSNLARTQREVRIDEVPYEIEVHSNGSGADTTLVPSSPSFGRLDADFLLEDRFNHGDDELQDSRDTTLLVSNDDRNEPNRNSYASIDDFNSVSSSISQGYTPSITTASIKSVYYSLSSETSSLL